jgi:hypothetical protein
LIKKRRGGSYSKDKDISPWSVIIIFLIILAIAGFLTFFVFGSFGDSVNFDSSVLIRTSMDKSSPQTEEIHIRNSENYDMVYELSTDGLPDIVKFSEDSFTLGPNQLKEIELTFQNLGELKEGVYTGSVVVLSGVKSNKIPFIIELTSKNPLVETIVKIFPGTDIAEGERLLLEMVFYDFKGNSPLDVELEYGLMDLESNKIVTAHENFNLDYKISLSRFLDFNKKVGEGDYVLYFIADYGEGVSTKSYMININKRKFFTLPGENQIYFIVLFVLFVVFFLIFVLYNENYKEEIVRRLKLQYHEELNSQVDYLKLKQKQSQAMLKTREEREKNKEYFENLIDKAKIQAATVQKERIRVIDKISVSRADNKRENMEQKLKKWQKEGYRLPSSLRKLVKNSSKINRRGNI